MQGDVHPPSEESSPDPIDDMAGIGERARSLNLKGCAPILIVAVVLITIFIGVLASRDDDSDNPSATSSRRPARPHPRPRRVAAETPSETPSESPSETPSPSAEGAHGREHAGRESPVRGQLR